jgi:CDP-diacylglycerol--glycerol-3-phosphate 3-phosphatidyltransferase
MTDRNQIAGDSLKLNLNIPNSLTLARVTLTIISAALLGQGSDRARLSAGILLILAWGTDWLDGFLARRLGQATLSGAVFDLIADRFLMTGILITSVIAGYWAQAANLMPWVVYPYLGVVWAADTALLSGIGFYLVKRKRFKLEFAGPPEAAKLAFPIQMATLVWKGGPDWLSGGLMGLTMAATLFAAYAYWKKGSYIFRAR